MERERIGDSIKHLVIKLGSPKNNMDNKPRNRPYT